MNNFSSWREIYNKVTFEDEWKKYREKKLIFAEKSGEPGGPPPTGDPNMPPPTSVMRYVPTSEDIKVIDEALILKQFRSA